MGHDLFLLQRGHVRSGWNGSVSIQGTLQIWTDELSDLYFPCVDEVSWNLGFAGPDGGGLDTAIVVPRPEAAGHLGRGQARERDWSRRSQHAGENRKARRALHRRGSSLAIVGRTARHRLSGPRSPMPDSESYVWLAASFSDKGEETARGDCNRLCDCQPKQPTEPERRRKGYHFHGRRSAVWSGVPTARRCISAWPTW